jgi:hypothetical protein
MRHMMVDKLAGRSHQCIVGLNDDVAGPVLI